MRGVYDVHVHAAPSIFARWGDAEQTVEACEAAGMAGLVFKAHHGSTAELAGHLNKKVTMEVFGGVVLNYFVGGLNPYAVDACCALGGKIVWLPTIHAAAHQPLGRFEFQAPKTAKLPTQGIRIADSHGLVKPMYEILEILNGKKVVLATGHVSSKEIKILVDALREHRFNVRLLVNHVHFFSPDLGRAEVEALKGDKVWFEVSHFSQKIGAATIEKTARLIRTTQPEVQWVLVSDSGQPGNKAPRALETFRQLLLEQGVKPNLLQQMMTTTPRELLT